jgi:hypothetical protein
MVTENSMPILRSEPLRSLGRIFVPSRFQISGGTSPQIRNVFVVVPGSGSGSGVGTGSGERTSPRRNVVHSPAIADVLRVDPDKLVELGSFCHLSFQFGGQSDHFLLEGFTIVLDLSRADIMPRCEDVVVMADVVERGALAEAGYVTVNGDTRTPGPSPSGRGEFGGESGKMCGTA